MGQYGVGGKQLEETASSLRLIILAAFPGVALWLPNQM